MTTEVMTEPLANASMANPMTLLQSMVEKGCDPEALKKMMDLSERWQANRAREEYFRAMVACQAEMPSVVKDAKNSFLNTNYATVEAIQKQCKPIWLKHGFSLSFSEEREAAADMICMRCDSMHSAGHVERYYARYPRDGEGAKGGKNMNPLQGTVSAHSYAERDMTTLVFNITVSGRDADGNNDPPITPDQIEELNGLIEDCSFTPDPVDMPRFFAYLSVENMGQLRYTGYQKAKHVLLAKKKKAVKA